MGGGTTNSLPSYYNQYSTAALSSSSLSTPMNTFDPPTLPPRPYSYTPTSSTAAAPPPLPPVPIAYTRQSTCHPQYNQDIATTPATIINTTEEEQPHLVRLVYTKSGFYLQEPDHQNSIQGYFTIIYNGPEDDPSNLYLAWIPQYLIDPFDVHEFNTLDNSLATDQGYPNIRLHIGHNETTIISISKIHSLYIHPPRNCELGSIVITTVEGDVLRPLWYKSNNPFDVTWPGYNIVDILTVLVNLQKDPDDDYVYIFNTPETAIPSLYPQPPPPMSPTNYSASTYSVSEADPLYHSLSEARWNILERFSRITRASRATAATILDHPVAQPIVPLLPTSIQALSRNGTVQETLKDYNMARYYLSQWANDAPTDTLSDDDQFADGLLKDMPEMQLPLPNHTRREPILPEEWVDYFDNEGVLQLSVSHIKKLIFQGGLHADVRIEAWKFLLGIYPWDSTFDEREAIRQSKADEYYQIKAKWFNDVEARNSQKFLEEKHRIDKDVHRTDRNIDFFAGEELPNPDPQMSVGTNANMEILKDILVTYNFHNTKLGYVQGMSDLCAPMFVGMGDEAMAFWGFVNFMDRVQSNFFTDQSGMHRQLKTLNALIKFMDPQLYKHLEETETTNLFFCFRWLLVWFKREFDWEDVIRLWEVLWTDHLSSQFLLFVALSVLHQHREIILTELGQFDELLKYINELNGKIALNETLQTAEILYYQFERRIAAIDGKQIQLQQKLQKRSVWNNEMERKKIQASIKKLTVDDELRKLLK
ncbi:unnamed protein product [Cunninghamella echinulata]